MFLFQKLHKLLPLYFIMRQTLGEKRVRFSSCSGCPAFRAKARPGLVSWHGSPAASMATSRGEGCGENRRASEGCALTSAGL